MSHDVLLFLHLIGAFLWFGAGVAATTLRLGAIGRSRPSEVALLYRAVRPAIPLLALGLALVLVFGFWLTSDGNWDLGATWLSLTFALLLYSVVVGALTGRQDRHTRELAEHLAESGDVATPELVRRLRDPVNLLLSGSLVAATIVIVALMVWKPGS